MANSILVDVDEGVEKPVWIENVEPFVGNVMESLGYDGEELSILFCSDAFIRKLNGEYRNIMHRRMF